MWRRERRRTRSTRGGNSKSGSRATNAANHCIEEHRSARAAENESASISSDRHPNHPRIVKSTDDLKSDIRTTESGIQDQSQALRARCGQSVPHLLATEHPLLRVVLPDAIIRMMSSPPIFMNRTDFPLHYAQAFTLASTILLADHTGHERASLDATEAPELKSSRDGLAAIMLCEVLRGS